MKTKIERRRKQRASEKERTENGRNIYTVSINRACQANHGRRIFRQRESEHEYVYVSVRQSVSVCERERQR